MVGLVGSCWKVDLVQRPVNRRQMHVPIVHNVPITEKQSGASLDLLVVSNAPTPGPKLDTSINGATPGRKLDTNMDFLDGTPTGD